MKRNKEIPVCVLVLALSSPIVAVATDYGSPSDASSYQVQNSTSGASVTGTVQSVDLMSDSVNIKDTSGSLQKVQVDNGTQISLQGNTIQLTELKKGDFVTIKNANSTL